MLVIPNIIDDSVPLVSSDLENVEMERFGEPVVPIMKYHIMQDILEKFAGLDKEASGRTSGNGFYFLIGDMARLIVQC